MRCHYFDDHRCRSCALMGVDYAEQLGRKQAQVAAALPVVAEAWLSPQPSRESGFRNKAKFVVGGRAGAVTLGILDNQQAGVDIRRCGLLEPTLAALMQPLADVVDRLGLTPYDVGGRRGELKYLIATTSPSGRAMVRFVLRSEAHLPGLRTALADLLTAMPQVDVVSVNLHPEHRAVLQGDTEITLTEQASLPLRVNDVMLEVGPRSFFQTNTAVAEALYRQARHWAGECATVWDLYCGVGGFALHLLGPATSVVGIEVTPEAIEYARRGAAHLAAQRPGLGKARFVAGDAAAYVGSHAAPDLVVVNPPRRGLDESLCHWLNTSGVQRVLYSSCNVSTLRRDLLRLKWFTVSSARLFDMFPQTEHHEVMVLLERDVAATPGRRRRSHPPRR